MRRHVVVIAAIALESLACAVDSSLKKEATHPATLPAGEFATDPEVVLWQMFGDERLRLTTHGRSGVHRRER